MSDILNKGKEILSAIEKKGKGAYSIVKLQAEIYDLQNKLDKHLEQLGKISYELMKSDEDVLQNPEVVDLNQEIESLQKKLSSLKNQLATLKGYKLCPSCGSQNAQSNSFCGKCGKSF